MDETVEEDVVEEVKEQITQEQITEPIIASNIQQTSTNLNTNTNTSTGHLSFNDIDYIKTEDGQISNVNAPKTISRLEEISTMRAQQRKMEEDDEEDNIKLNISEQSFNLDALDIHNIEEPKIELLPDLLFDDIEILS